MRPSRETITWDGPPDPPPAESVMKDPTCHGILGLTLHQALAELARAPPPTPTPLPLTAETGEQKPDEAVVPVAVATQDANTAKTRIKSEMIPHIVASLGEAIAKTQQERRDETPCCAALLRGRIHHYNRRGPKWRIVVENAELCTRYPLDRDRRRRNRPSLWSASEKAKSSDANVMNDNNNSRVAADDDNTAQRMAGTTMEILAYNDKE